jgi:acetyl-CoA carboxylase carboxyltransferase component
MPEEDPRIVKLRAMREQAQLGGGADRIAKQHAKGKLTARERIDLLLDPGTFQELEPFVVQQIDELGISSEKYLGDGVVTGYGLVDGRTVYVYARISPSSAAQWVRCRAARSAGRWIWQCAAAHRWLA